MEYEYEAKYKVELGISVFCFAIYCVLLFFVILKGI